MTKNTVNETERMVVTRVFDAPRELVWKAWTDPKYVMQWWGPEGFTAPVCKMDFRVGGKFLCCMKSPDGQEFWNAVEYHEIVPYEKIVSLMYFSDSKGNKIDPAQLGMEHEALEGAYDVTIFEDLETARRNLPSLAMNPWRARKTAVNSRAGTRYSINLLRLLPGWYRRNRKLTLDDRHARDNEREVNAVHPCNLKQGWLRRLNSIALSSTGRIVALTG